MTVAEVWSKANENKFFDLFVDLKVRWDFEKEYEEIGDYLKVIQKYIPSAVQMTKRPFGFKCNASDGGIHIYLKKEGTYIKLFGKRIK